MPAVKIDMLKISDELINEFSVVSAASGYIL
jgi:hypothetical protein